MRVVSIFGPIGAGKSTAAKAICDSLGDRATIIPMAESLKTMARSLGWDGAKDDRGRRLLQDLGSSMRALDPVYWIKLWAPKAFAFDYMHEDAIVVVDDVRYYNEYIYMLGFDAVSIRVEGHVAGRDAGHTDHESERDWLTFKFDEIVDSNSAIESYQARVVATVRRLL